jgi:subfamily B ATP-binding cassette protein MsbA
MQEWFDKEYTARYVYGRLFKQARRYRWALAMGIVSGMVLGGTLVPIYQVLQPAVMQMQSGGLGAGLGRPAADPGAPAADGRVTATDDSRTKGAMPGWVRKVEQVAARWGITILNDSGNVRISFFLLVLLAVPLAFLLRLGMLYLNSYTLQWAGTRVVRDLRNEMFIHLQNQSLKFFGTMDVGRIMSRCNGDPATVQTVITQTVVELCKAPFEILASVGFVAYFAITNDMVEMIVLAVIGYPLVMWPLAVIGKKIRGYSRKGMERSAILGSNMLENLTGIRVVKAYHTEEAEKEKFKRSNQECVKVALRGIRISLLVNPMMEGATILLSILFLAVCFWRGKTFAEIVPLLTPMVVAYKPLKSIGKIQSSIQAGRAALTRIYSFLDTDTALPQAAHPVSKKTFDAEMVFDHVDFAYAATDRKVVQDANFVLGRGQTVAVVGATGSGKTTLANLLARFYDPTQGRVLMDGVDLREMDMADLRKLIGVVTQETILFNTTIAANIAYGTPGATQEQVEAAAKLANAHAFILRHPDGYRRIVGDKGFVLSGGERQRVAVARAILKNPPILILDEATSALDTVTEQQVQEAIARLMENRTVFVIAHRLSTVRHADTILVMDQGRIIEKGGHDALYAAGGAYRNLCDVQKSVR